MSEIQIIQGGMGVAVSGWKLASAVSRMGQLGVVSGTALDCLLVRQLQLGDADGHLRRALAAFPDSRVAANIVEKYHVPPGSRKVPPFKYGPMLSQKISQEHLELIVAGNFVEVFLAKEGHGGKVGINYLEKIRLPTLPSLYGAMLAGVDYVLMGAGIPRQIPLILDRLVDGLDVELRLDITGASSEDFYSTLFSPKDFWKGSPLPLLRRPKFFPIVSSSALATTLLRKSEGEVNGFVVETPFAGGHNAPPRGKMELNSRGEPIYGPRDEVDFAAMRELRRPFWLGGAYGSPEGLRKAKELGAAGIQVGTAFALSDESGFDPILKAKLIWKILHKKLDIFTDPQASPTGFPFKVAQMEETASDLSVYQERPRICDLGYLREIFKKEDGSLGYRCAAEPVELYLKKGGKFEDTNGRKCLCNSLLANIGLAQTTKNYLEKALVTLGDDVNSIVTFLKPGKDSYSAREVIEAILQAPVPITV